MPQTLLTSLEGLSARDYCPDFGSGRGLHLGHGVGKVGEWLGPRTEQLQSWRIESSENTAMTEGQHQKLCGATTADTNIRMATRGRWYTRVVGGGAGRGRTARKCHALRVLLVQLLQHAPASPTPHTRCADPPAPPHTPATSPATPRSESTRAHQ